MQIQLEDVSPVEKRLAVEIPWETVRAKLDAAYRELGKGAQVPGFRKGKVPRAMLERMYGKHVQQEVARELVQESFLAAAKEHALDPVAEPVVEDARLKLNESFRYSARVEVRGKVEIGTWEGLTAVRKKVAVKDEEVERALEHRRMMQTELKAIEGRDVTAESDVVVVALKGKVGEHAVDRPEVQLDLSEPQHEPLPGLAKALTGVSLSSKDLAVALDIPEDFPQKEVAGKRAELTVTVREAREKQVPVLDDEFAKDTGEADTLAELRQKTRERLEQQQAAANERDVREQILKDLVAKNQIPVAASLVERGIDSQIHRARYSLAMQGIDLDQSGVDLTGMRDKLREGALNELRGQLLLEALAETHKIEVDDAEVDRRIAEAAQAQGKPAHKVKAEMQKEGTLDSFRWRLRQDKALDLVVQRATISEETPS